MKTPNLNTQIQAQNSLLKEQVRLLIAQVEIQNQQINDLSQQVKILSEQNEYYKRKLFGKKSEKIIPESREIQLYLEGCDKLFPIEPEPENKKPVKGYDRTTTKCKGKDKITFPDDLPIEKQYIDIPDDQKICPDTGKPLIKIGEEITSKLAYRPGSYYIKQIIRPKYALPQNSTGGICIAPLPDSLLIRCQADESFLADILTKKFNSHLPLYRICEMIGQNGINISRQLLSQWVIRCGEALKPLYDEMSRQILLTNNIFIDESPIAMLKPGKGKTHTAFMWVIVGGNAANPPYRVYNFRTNRQHHHALDLLNGYAGVLHSDKYAAYETLASRKQFIWCPCFAHLRRKFFEVESGDLEFRDWVLRKIRYLFMLEKVAWSRSEEERLRIRLEKECPIIDELIAKITDKLINGKCLPKSKLNQALGYFYGLIPYLKNYTQHPWSRLDNNVAERAVRPLAIGRKNWLFVGNEVGGDAAAVILSLVQTCRALGLNPYEYLEDVMRRLMSHSANKLFELLPDQWAKSKTLA